jgi:acyl transferase domain-containing protein
MNPSSEKSWHLDDPASDAVEPIAIIGIAARFAKDALSMEDLRDILLEARSTWSPIPKERFNSEAFYHPDPEHGGTVR